MGHSSPTVTANTYADLHADQLDDVAKNMDRIITKTGQEPDKKKIETVERRSRSIVVVPASASGVLQPGFPS